jgi:hypothetical protein
MHLVLLVLVVLFTHASGLACACGLVHTLCLGIGAGKRPEQWHQCKQLCWHQCWHQRLSCGEEAGRVVLGQQAQRHWVRTATGAASTGKDADPAMAMFLVSLLLAIPSLLIGFLGQCGQRPVSMMGAPKLSLSFAQARLLNKPDE